MTTVTVPIGLESRIVGLCVAIAFRPTSPTIGDGSLTWNPDLTAAEQTIVARIVKVANSPVSISPDEWAAIENDVALCKTFLGTATPTLAQNVAATKSLIRIMAALIRN